MASRWSLIVLSLVVALLAAIVPAQEPSPTPSPMVKAELALNWFPEAEHGGFYAALVHGLYRDAGIEMKILPGGPNVPTVTMVATGKVPFAVCNADEVLIARGQGARVVALMAPLQMSPRCLIVHEDSGITGFGELKNLTLAMSADNAFAQFIKSKYPLEGVTIVPYAGNVAPFLVKKHQAIQGYSFSEPFVIRQKGGNPRLMMVHEIGFNPYTSLLITSEEYLAANRETVAKVTEASLRGWVRYMESPRETNAYINSLNPEMGMEILEFGVSELKPLVFTEESTKLGLGTMSAERWETLLKQLEDLKIVKAGGPAASTAFTLDFFSKKE